MKPAYNLPAVFWIFEDIQVKGGLPDHVVPLISECLDKSLVYLDKLTGIGIGKDRRDRERSVPLAGR